MRADSTRPIDALRRIAAVLGMPKALRGATTATRYVGGTASAAPTIGTFALGDFVIAQNGHIWVCTTAGTPGTWTDAGAYGAGGGGIAATIVDAKGDLIVATAADTVARKAVGIDKMSLTADSAQGDGLFWTIPDAKDFAVHAATTANITLSGTQTVDGVALVAGNYCLVKDQTQQYDGGVYIVSAGAWTRHPAFDSGPELASVSIRVLNGTVNGASVWQSTHLDTDTIGSNGRLWFRVPHAYDIAADQSGISVNLDSTGRPLFQLDVTGKRPVHAATTANITLSGYQTIDGFNATSSHRVLVKDQTAASENGIYIPSVGSWARAEDADTATDIAGREVGVLAGTVNGGTIWRNNFKSTDTLGTTAMTWKEVYSDLNPPQTLDMTEFASGSVPTPASGKATLNTADGSQVFIKDDGGTQRVVGEIVPLQYVTTDYVDTTPTAPTTGMKLFSRNRARRIPAYIGPAGQDSQLQPSMFSNRINMWDAINNGTTGSAVGGTWTPVGNAAQANAATNFFTGMVRVRHTSGSTAGSAAGLRSASAQWFTSATSNLGGFFFVCRFGLATVQTNTRGFIGLSSTTGQLAGGTNPSALLNLVGFGWDAGQTTLRVMCNDGTGTATTVQDLGANFPVTASAATYFYEVRLFAASGAGNSITWSAHRLNDGIVTNAGSAITTDLPAVGTLLSAHVHYSNGTNAAAHSIDIQKVYVETDN